MFIIDKPSIVKKWYNIKGGNYIIDGCNFYNYIRYKLGNKVLDTKILHDNMYLMHYNFDVIVDLPKFIKQGKYVPKRLRQSKTYVYNIN